MGRTLLLLILLPAALSAQTKTVTGTVRDEAGMPMQAASVTIKGTTRGTKTTPRGEYSISVPPDATLVFSYIGYAPYEQKITSASVYNIILRRIGENVDEVVVIGYGSVKRKDLTGAVGSVNMKEFEKAPVKSFDEALAGRIAGVTVASNDGQPGSVANIVIRGTGSITGSSAPLYVIDGIQLEEGQNNAINPADIESIDVLKDASATAIYGARGANGVIIITTKKGKAGPPLVDYSLRIGVQQYTKKMDLMKPYDFVKYATELNANLDTVYFGTNPETGGKVTLDQYKNLPGNYVQDELIKSAPFQDHSLSVRGGNDKTRYAISGNINTQDGIVVNSGFKRYQGRIVLDQTVNSKLKVGINANYAYSRSYGSIISSGNFNATLNTMYNIWSARPTIGIGRTLSADALYDDQVIGSGSPTSNQYGDYRVNPSLDLRNKLEQSISQVLTTNAYAEYSILPSLRLKVTGGINTTNNERKAFYNSKTNYGSVFGFSGGPNGYSNNNKANTWINTNTLTYTPNISKDHHLTVLLGQEMTKTTNSLSQFNSSKIPVANEGMGLDALGLGASITAVSASSRNAQSSVLGRISYDYLSRYMLTASFRGDGSSKFAEGNKWGYFPSFSVAWRLSSEPFMESLRFVSDAKIRGGYGAIGNNRVSDFAYLAQLAFASGANVNYYSYNNQLPGLAAALTALGNTDLQWEAQVQTNVGLDLGLFKERVGLTVDWYKKTSKDLLLLALLPATTGVSSGYRNVGELENKGLEVTVRTTNVQTKKFRWTTNFNIAFNRNKVTSLNAGQRNIITNIGFTNPYDGVSPYISVLGQSVGLMYGLIWDGVYQYSDFDAQPNGTYVLKNNVTTNGNNRASIKPGDIKYRDLNGDLIVNSNDYSIIGNGLPFHAGGISNDFSWKGFDLNVFFQWSKGNDIINANRYLFEGNSNPNTNQFASYANRWTPDNQTNSNYRAGGGGASQYSSRVIEDGSYLRLKTVSLGYRLPASLLKKVKMRGVRLYVSAQNLYTWTNYSGPDPEVSTRNSALTPGFDYSAYPRARTIIGGIDFNF